MTQDEIVTLAQQLLDKYPPLGALAGAGAAFLIVLGVSLLSWCWSGVRRTRSARRSP